MTNHVNLSGVVTEWELGAIKDNKPMLRGSIKTSSGFDMDGSRKFDEIPFIAFGKTAQASINYKIGDILTLSGVINISDYLFEGRNTRKVSIRILRIEPVL